MTTRELVIVLSTPAAPTPAPRSPIGPGYQVLAVILAGWVFGAGYALSPLIQDYSDAAATLPGAVPLALGIGAPIGVFIATCSLGAAKLWTLVAPLLSLASDLLQRIVYATAAVAGTSPLFFIIITGETGAIDLLVRNAAIPAVAFVSAFVAYPWFEKTARRRHASPRRPA